jgi:hypothetical protein
MYSLPSTFWNSLQQGGKGGDRLWAVELELLCRRKPASLEQLLQHQQHGAVPRQAAVVNEGFAVVGASQAKGRGAHRGFAERIDDAVEGNQPQGLLNLTGPEGQAALQKGLKSRKLCE